MLTFSEADHVYRWHGEPVPSVSAIIKSTGLAPDYTKIDPEVLHRAAARGAYVDQCCALLDRGELDRDRLHPETVAYVNAWERCKREQGFAPVRHQGRIYHPVFKYAGSYDVDVEHAEGPVRVDLKCTWKIAPTYRLQVAGYTQPGLVQADGTPDPTPRRRAVVQLKRDGTYRIEWYTDGADDDAWCAAVVLYHWQQQRKAA